MVSDTNFLDTWQAWDCGLRSPPIVLEVLTGGRTNRSLLLDADGTRTVMRVNAPTDGLPGVDRAREVQIWKAASAAKLAPSLLFVDPNQRFLITEYIDGQALDPSNLTASSLDRLFGLLAAVHGLDVKPPLLDYSIYIERYWKIIEAGQILHNAELRRRRSLIPPMLGDLIASNPETGLCHHDPAPPNVIASPDQFYLLDWEYATQGFVAMDYAALAVEWGIKTEVIIDRTGIDPTVLDMAKQLYRYICDLWQETSAGVRHQ